MIRDKCEEFLFVSIFSFEKLLVNCCKAIHFCFSRATWISCLIFELPSFIYLTCWWCWSYFYLSFDCSTSLVSLILKLMSLTLRSKAEQSF